LKISPDDWYIVLNANKNYRENPDEWRGSPAWGRYIVSRIAEYSKTMDFRKSVELCSGNGFLFFCFKDLFDATQNCSFVDLSYAQCEVFKKRCLNLGILPPAIVCGDIGKLAFEDNSLNSVYGYSFLHHLPDVGAYLREANRVLVPGGKFIAFHEPTATADFFERFPLSIFNKAKNGSLTDIWVISPAVILKLLQENGFTDIKIFSNRLLSSIFIEPFTHLLRKINFFSYSELEAHLRLVFDKIEQFIPLPLRLRLAPSIAIYAEKSQSA
jgi:ubiquinone/menaquinone biosynthesis C-methylase UbiE